MVFSHCNENYKYSIANDIVRITAQNGHLSVIKAFIKSYKTAINFSLAIYLAKENGHQKVVDFLASEVPSYHGIS